MNIITQNYLAEETIIGTKISQIDKTVEKIHSQLRKAWKGKKKVRTDFIHAKVSPKGKIKEL